MAEGLTLETIIARVGRNLLGVGFHNSTATSPGSTTSLVDASLRGGPDVHNGRWIYMTSGDNDGEETVADDFDGSGTLTLSPALTNATASGDTYMMFSPEYSAATIKDAINQAINDVMGRFYKREESLALHADGRTARFDLPSEFDMVDKVEYRKSVRSVPVHDCDSTFDETTDVDFTQSTDTEDNKTGQSLKLVVAAAASAGDYIEDTISEADLSGLTHVEGWVKSNKALDAADYRIILSNGTVDFVSDVLTLDVPAVSADTWTRFRISFDNSTKGVPSLTNIAIEMNVDKGLHTIWFDDIKAVDHDSAVWTRLDKHLWGVDREEQDLVLTPSGRRAAGYALLKLKGGSNPAQMTANSDTATVPESYLISKATGLLLLGGSRASDQDTDGRRSLGAVWLGTADREKGKFGPLVSARKVT